MALSAVAACEAYTSAIADEATIEYDGRGAYCCDTMGAAGAAGAALRSVAGCISMSLVGTVARARRAERHRQQHMNAAMLKMPTTLKIEMLDSARSPIDERSSA